MTGGTGRAVPLPCAMNTPPEIAYLGLGSNLGDRARNLGLAAMRLALTPGLDLLRLSPVYESAPWGMEDQPRFLNMVVAVRAALEPEALLGVAKRIEGEMGRQPTVRWGPRCIDMDILLYGDRRVEAPELTIPHPRIGERSFVLAPLADIAPEEAGEWLGGLRADGDGLHRMGPLGGLLQGRG